VLSDAPSDEDLLPNLKAQLESVKPMVVKLQSENMQLLKMLRAKTAETASKSCQAMT
jgi:hypothetical protein